jgi:hypothetical protein
MKNLKKRLFGIALIVVILLSISLVTFAEPIDDDGNKPRREIPPVVIVVPDTEMPQE